MYVLLIAMSAVRWCSVRHRETGNKNPAIADGMECVRFCRDMDSDNNAVTQTTFYARKTTICSNQK